MEREIGEGAMSSDVMIIHEIAPLHSTCTCALEDKN